MEEMVRQGVLEGDADNNFKLVEYDENGANVIRLLQELLRGFGAFWLFKPQLFSC